MSEIKSFSDYTSKYNSNVDYSALFGGTSDSSSVGNIAEYKTKLIDKSILQRKLAELYDIAEEEVKNSQQD